MDEDKLITGQTTEQDLLYVQANGTRIAILRHLADGLQKGNYVKLVDLAKAIQAKPSAVSFHCKGLHQRELVEEEMVVRKKHLRITGRGKLVLAEVAARRGP